MKYAPLIFDVVESRRYNDRYVVQNLLLQTVSYLNRIYERYIMKDVMCGAGDEFQGLFVDMQSAFLYVRKLQLLIYPVKIRCGIGYGELSYYDEDWSSANLTGEAHHLCREALKANAKRKSNIVYFNSSSMADKYLNSLSEATYDLKAHQSQSVKLIELLADVILPLRPVQEDVEFYKFILQNRDNLIEQEDWNKTTGRASDFDIKQIDFDLLLKVKESIKSKDYCSEKFYFEDFWLHGMSTSIADIISIKRQNVDRYVLQGKVKESRTMDRSIYEMLGESVW